MIDTPASIAASHPAESDRRFIVAAILLTIGVRLLLLALTNIRYEDSLISLRYAENLAQGHGLVFNPGERVFGASTPLYVLMLAGFSWAGMPAVETGRAMAVAADAATLWLWLTWTHRQTAGKLAPCVMAILFGISPLIAPITISGMETSLALLFMSIAVQGETDDRPHWLGSGLGLLMLTRPDGLIAAVVLLISRWVRHRRFPWLPATIAAAMVAPWLIFALGYYGSIVPHSIPAKAAAYNLHRPSMLPNFIDTLAQVMPIRGPWGRVVTNMVVLPMLVAGVGSAWKSPALRCMPALLGLWWLYLVLPKTLLFPWYFPLLVLPALVLAALGAPRLADALPRLKRLSWECAIPAVLAVGLVGWLQWVTGRQMQVQRAEGSVRREIGLYLNRVVRTEERVAVEPIGYIGYFSQRRLLDEVGLVSPEMVPLNRRGAGWFGEMVSRFRPAWIVERPGYLLRNTTINSRVRLWNTVQQRLEFVATYRPVATFASTAVPPVLRHDYRFVVFRRREAADAARVRRRLAALPQEVVDRCAWLMLTGHESDQLAHSGPG